MPAPSKRIFIQTINAVPLWGEKCVPTALHYTGEKEFTVGFKAEHAANDALDVNRDFKVDLGHLKTGAANPQAFISADGESRSAKILTRDFMSSILAETNRFLSSSGVDQATRLMVAEPLNMHSEENSDWLANYRANLRDLLRGVTFKGSEKIRFDEIAFLPEPFAVFQYYRYGVRFPAITGRQKYCALVIDFGGGTFDVCVVETTQDGEISQSGKNSRPFGASSVPIGGFHINRKIIEYLLLKYVVDSDDGRKYRRGLAAYTSFRDNHTDFQALAPDIQNFIKNFQRAAFEVERVKLKLCHAIHDWKLDADLTQTENVLLPVNMFSEDMSGQVVIFSAKELRDIFWKEVWGRQLSDTIKNAMTNAASNLRGQPINLVLLSGGSANIGWLSELLRTEFVEELRSATFLPLEDYKEVVSKGLAVECARRFYSETATGDFESVIYNPLWLLVDVANTGIKPRKFQPLESALPDCSAQPGLLIDAATSLEKLIDLPMNWKMRGTGSTPKNLKYYFLRTGGEAEGTQTPAGVSPEAMLNFEENRLDAPPGKAFDSDLKVRLEIRSDGTACPTFIFKSPNNSDGEEVKKTGKPFFIDMTAAQRVKHSPHYAYVGLDFGTSNTSLSLVTQRTIQEMEDRSRHASWQELAELPGRLPHPLAEPLQSFVSETLNKERAANSARQFVEAALTLAFVSGYLDHCIQMGEASQSGTTKLLFDLRQNSPGPVWARIKELYLKPRHLKSPRLSSAWSKLVETPVLGAIDLIVEQIAYVKHDKAKLDDIEWHDTLHALGNIAANFAEETHFGFIENVDIDALSGEVVADFRLALGKPPFHRRLKLSLPKALPAKQSYLVHASTKMAVSLLPFYHFDNKQHSMSYDHGLLHTLDQVDARKKSLSYKNCFREPPVEILETDKPLGALVTMLMHRWDKDIPVQPISPINIITEELSP